MSTIKAEITFCDECNTEQDIGDIMDGSWIVGNAYDAVDKHGWEYLSELSDKLVCAHCWRDLNDHKLQSAMEADRWYQQQKEDSI